MAAKNAKRKNNIEMYTRVDIASMHGDFNLKTDVSWSSTAIGSISIIQNDVGIVVSEIKKKSKLQYVGVSKIFKLDGVPTEIVLGEREGEHTLACISFDISAGALPPFLFEVLDELGASFSLSETIKRFGIEKVVISIVDDIDGLPQDQQKTLKRGLNFIGQMKSDNLPEDFRRHSPIKQLDLYGTYVSVSDNMDAYPAGNGPWRGNIAPFGTVLNAPIGGVITIADFVDLKDLVLHIYLPPKHDKARFPSKIPPQVGMSGGISLRAKTQMPIQTSFAAMYSTSGGFSIQSCWSNASLGNIATLPELETLSSALTQLPAGLKALDQFQLTQTDMEIGAEFSRDALRSLRFVFKVPGSIKLPGLDLAFSNPLLSFDLINPFGNRAYRIRLMSRVEIGRTPLSAIISMPDKRISISLEEGNSLNLKDLVSSIGKELGGNITAPSKLSVDRLEISADLGSSQYRFLAVLANGDEQSLKIGSNKLSLRDIWIEFARERGATSYKVAGSVALNESLSIDLEASSENGFKGTLAIPKISFKEIFKVLDPKEVVPFAKGITLELVDTRLELGIDKSRFQFMASSRVENVGSVALVAKKSGGNWWFAAGVRVKEGGFTELGRIVPSLQKVTEALVSVVELKDFLLVVSSADGISKEELGPLISPPKSASTTNAVATTSSTTSDIQIKDKFDKGITIYARVLLRSPVLLPVYKLIRGKDANPLNDYFDSLLYFALPNPSNGSRISIQLPKTDLKPGMISGSFGIELRNSNILGFIQGEYEGAIGNNQISAVVVGELSPTGIMLAGAVKGDITFEDGQRKIVLTNLGLAAGISTAGVPSVGFTGAVKLGAVEGAVAVFLDGATLASSVIAGTINDLNLKTAVEAVTGVAVDASFGKVLDGFKLQRIEAFKVASSQNLAAALADAVPKAENMKSGKGGVAHPPKVNFDKIRAVFAKHKENIPNNNKDIRLRKNWSKQDGADVRKKGIASEWTLMDLNEFKHYQIIINTDGSAVVYKSPELYIAPVGGKFADFTFSSGFRMAGRLDTPIGGAQAHINVDTKAPGIIAKAEVDRISIGSEKIFLLSDKAGTGKASLDICSYTVGDKDPHADIDGSLKILGQTLGAFKGAFTTSGFHFSGELNPPGTYSFTVAGSASKDGVRFTGKMTATGIPHISLGQFGEINIKTGISGTLKMSGGIKDQPAIVKLKIRMKVLGKDSIEEEFEVSINIEDIYKFIKPKLEIMLRKSLPLAEDCVKLLKKTSSDVLKNADVLFKGLKAEYNVTAKGAAIVASEVGRTSKEIVQGLGSAYNASQKVSAESLHAAGKAAGEAGEALEKHFNLTREKTTALLRGAEYTSTEVAKALTTVFGESQERAQKLLVDAGYTANQVGEALKNAFNLGANEVAKSLKALNFKAKETAAALHETFKCTQRSISDAMRLAEYGSDQIMAAIKNIPLLNATNDVLVMILLQGNYSLEQIANGMRHGLKLGGHEAAMLFRKHNGTVRDAVYLILKHYHIKLYGAVGFISAAGYQWVDIAKELTFTHRIELIEIARALKIGAGADMWAVARTLNSVGLNVSAADMIFILRVVYSLDFIDIVRCVLSLNKYTWLEIAQVLRNSHGLSFFAIAQIMKVAGGADMQTVANILRILQASPSEVIDILRQLYSASNDTIFSVMRSAGYALSEIKRLLGKLMPWNW